MVGETNWMRIYSTIQKNVNVGLLELGFRVTASWR